MEVHRTSEAVLERLAVSALTRFHPLTVAEELETVFPNVQEIILVDVALHVVAVDVGASGYGAVNKNRAARQGTKVHHTESTSLSERSHWSYI